MRANFYALAPLIPLAIIRVAEALNDDRRLPGPASLIWQAW